MALFLVSFAFGVLIWTIGKHTQLFNTDIHVYEETHHTARRLDPMYVCVYNFFSDVQHREGQASSFELQNSRSDGLFCTLTYYHTTVIKQVGLGTRLTIQCTINIVHTWFSICVHHFAA